MFYGTKSFSCFGYIFYYWYFSTICSLSVAKGGKGVIKNKEINEKDLNSMKPIFFAFIA